MEKILKKYLLEELQITESEIKDIDKDLLNNIKNTLRYNFYVFNHELRSFMLEVKNSLRKLIKLN